MVVEKQIGGGGEGGTQPALKTVFLQLMYYSSKAHATYMCPNAHERDI